MSASWVFMAVRCGLVDYSAGLAATAVAASPVASSFSLTITSAQFGGGILQNFKIVVLPNNAINFSYCRHKTHDFSIKIIYF
jgi:hypothetical protein